MCEKTPSTFPLSRSGAFTATATRTVELPSTRKQTTYTVNVALDGIIYTPRSSGDFLGYNPLKMIVGTELEARVEAIKLVITRPDGKQYKPTITRRERDQAASH
jgi:hypothetical protein